MICPCGRLVKKRTLVDGIKSLSGTLNIYVYRGDLHLQDCCFKTLIPSLYTFINQNWFLRAEMVAVGQQSNHPEPMLIYRITTELMALIMSYSASDGGPLTVLEISAGIVPLAEGYLNHLESLNKAYQTVISLEKDMKGIRYQYSSLVYDNDCLNKQIALFRDRSGSISITDGEETELMRHGDRIDVGKLVTTCPRCASFSTIKEDLKLLKTENHERIAKMQYEHEIDRQKLGEMQYNSKRMQEEILRLKEENRLLRTTNHIDHSDLCMLVDHC